MTVGGLPPMPTAAAEVGASDDAESVTMTGDVLAELGAAARPDGRVPVLADVTTVVPPAAEEFEDVTLAPGDEVIDPRAIRRSLGGDRYQLEIMTAPMLFQVPSGEWRKLDMRLVPTATADGLVPRSAPEGVLKIAATMRPEAPFVTVALRDGRQVEMLQTGLARSDGMATERHANGAAAFVPGALASGGDVVVQPLRSGFEQSVVIGEHAPGWYEVQFRLPEGVDARQGTRSAEDDPTVVFSEVEFLDRSSGEVLATFGGGMAFEDPGDPTGATTPALTTLRRVSGGMATVRVSVEQEWLDDPARVWPVVIDPTWISYTDSTGYYCPTSSGYDPFATCDTYVNSDTYNGAWHAQTQLRLGSPNSTEWDGSGHNRTRTFLKFATDNLSDPAYSFDVDAVTVKLRTYYAYDSTYYRYYQIFAASHTPNQSTRWSWHPARDSTRLAYAYQVGTGTMTFSSAGYPGLVDEVQKWFSPGSYDEGFRLETQDGQEREVAYFRQFYSSEYGSTTYTPKLTVDYTLVNRPPNVPGLVSPSNNAFYNGTGGPSQLSASYSDPDTYATGGSLQFQLYRLSGTSWTAVSGFPKTTSASNGSTRSVSVGTLSGGEYRWRVTAIDSGGLSATSSYRYFEVNTAPDVDQRGHTLGSQSGGSQSVTLQGRYIDPEADGGQVVFNVQEQLGGVWSNLPSKTVTSVTSGSTVSYELSITAEQGKQVRWRARATDEHGLADSSYPWETFSLEYLLPNAPTGVQSTSHVRWVPSQDPTVDMSWTAAAVNPGQAAVSHYDYAFTSTSEQPTAGWASTGGTSPTTATSLGTLEGEVWFHVRTIDDVGQTSATVTVGPYVVETLQVGHLGWDAFGAWSSGVNAALSNYVRTDTDMDIASVGHPLQMARTYNSRDLSDGWFGYGWTSTFEMAVEQFIDGGFARVLYPDGRREDHEFSVGAGFEPPEGYFSALADNGATWTLTRPDGTVYTFEAPVPSDGTNPPVPGRLLTITDRNGHQTVLDWQTAGAVTITDTGSGRRLDVVFDGDDHVDTVTVSDDAQAGQTLVWDYTVPTDTSQGPLMVCDSRPADASGNLPCWTYAYQERVLQSVTSPLGRQTVQIVPTPGGQGAVDAVSVPDRDGDGQRDTTTYTVVTGAGGSHVDVTDPRGNVTRLFHNAQLQLVERWLPGDDGQPDAAFKTVYGYTGGLRTSIIDATGVVTTMGYDAWGNVAHETVTEPASNPAHGISGFTPPVTTGMTGRTYARHFLYDAATNDLVAEWDPRADQTDGDDDGFPDDTRFTTRHGYDTAGNRLWTLTPPTTAVPTGSCRVFVYTDGSETVPGTTDTVDPGLLEATYAPNEVVVSGSGASASCAPATGAVAETRTYEANGDLASMVTPDPDPSDSQVAGLMTTYGYDGLGRKLTETVTLVDHGDVTTTWTYDQVSQITTVTDPSVVNPVDGLARQRKTTRNIDLDGRLHTETVSDVNGNDPARTVTCTYVGTSAVIHTVEDPEGGLETRGYDAAGNVTSVTDAEGRTIDTVFSRRGEPRQTILRGFTDPADPGTAARDIVLATRAYDPAGRLLTDTDPRGVLRWHAHDGMDRQTATVIVAHQDNGPVRNVIEEVSTFDRAGNVTRTERGTVGTGYRSTTHDVDEANRITATTVAGGDGGNRVTSFAYDTSGNLLQETINGPDGQAGSRTDTVEYGYDRADRRTSVTVDPSGLAITTRTRFDRRALPIATIDPRWDGTPSTEADFSTVTAYDQAGRPTTVTSPAVPVSADGTTPQTDTVTAVTGYDTYGNVTHQVAPVVTRTSGPGGTHEVAPSDPVTRTGYDRLDRRITSDAPAYDPPVGAPIAASETWQYDGVGNLVRHTSRRGQVTTWDYDDLNRATIHTSPTVDGQPVVTVSRFDDAGNATIQVDAEGGVTVETFDSRNLTWTSTRYTDRTTPGQIPDVAALTGPASVVAVDRDDLGNVTDRTRTDDPDVQDGQPGTVTFTETYDVDGLGQTTATTDADSNTATTTYDLAGRPVVETAADGNDSLTMYDGAGRAVLVHARDSQDTIVETTGTGYDRAGNVTTTVTPGGYNAGARTSGYETRYQVDLAGRTVQVDQDTGGTTMTTHYRHDAAGNLTGVVDGRGNLTRHTYNAWQLRETTTEPPLTGLPDAVWTVSYDAGGLPVTETQPDGITVARTYDPLARLRTETATGATDGSPDATRTLGYDRVGNLDEVDHPDGPITVDYNGLNLPTITRIDGIQTSRFGYDPAGRMNLRDDAAGTATFTYTQRDQLHTATDPLTGGTRTLDYRPDGPLATVDYGSGLARTYTYDELNRPDTDTVDQGNTQVSTVNVDYDSDGQIGAVTYQFDDDLLDIDLPQVGGNVTGNPARGTHTYSYDQAGRLTQWNNPAAKGQSANVTYLWDDANNRIEAGGTTFGYDARNRPQNDKAGLPVTWSNRGTLQQSGPTVYQFDALGRQTAAGTALTSYDGLDRIASTTGVPAVTMTYAGLELDPVADGTAVYGRDPSGTLTSLDADGALPLAPPTWAGRNPHGDLTFMYDPAADTLSGTRIYDPFGQAAGQTGLPTLTWPNLGFQSDWTDPVTGNVWQGARWYQPGNATFTARDTIMGELSRPVSLNRYLYGFANPLRFWDPDGRYGFDGAYTTTKAADGPGSTTTAGGGTYADSAVPLSTFIPTVLASNPGLSYEYRDARSARSELIRDFFDTRRRFGGALSHKYIPSDWDQWSDYHQDAYVADLLGYDYHPPTRPSQSTLANWAAAPFVFQRRIQKHALHAATGIATLMVAPQVAARQIHAQVVAAYREGSTDGALMGVGYAVNSLLPVVPLLHAADQTTRQLAAGHPLEAATSAADTTWHLGETLLLVEGTASGLTKLSERAGFNGGPRLAPEVPTARWPVGRRGSPMDVPRGTNPQATIGGRQYGGHALDEMMSEGFTPSVVEDAIKHGQVATGASGRVAYYSGANNVTVILENGRVVTVTSGTVKIR